MTLEDLKAIKETRALLLNRYIARVHPVGWSVDQLKRIYDLSPAQVYALNHLSDALTLKLWGRLADRNIVTQADFQKVVDEHGNR